MNGSELDRPVGDPTPLERVTRPLQVFARYRGAGALVLLAAAGAALVWANSPAAPLYYELLARELVVGYGELELAKPLQLWINDGLMGVFFFVVGLEIKREVLAGELATPRKAMLPVVAALGGMLVPAAAFAAFNLGEPGIRGWGIPMATDIAFALGLLSLVASERVPVGLKVFLTALAIVDDLGAIAVIAVFYTERVSLLSLGVGGLLLGVSAAANAAGLRSAVGYFLVGTLVWLAFLKSGVHATVAAVLMALTIPARTRIAGESFLGRMAGYLERLRRTGVPSSRRLITTEQQELLQRMDTTIDAATAPLQRIERALLPLVAFLVLPVFALANAGVPLTGEVLGGLSEPVGAGILVGLFFGKQAGIFGFAWLAVRLHVADLPRGVGWHQLHAVSVLGGIGFTMALFIGGLAYRDPSQLEAAKVGILAASVLSGVTGALLLRAAPQPERPA